MSDRFNGQGVPLCYEKPREGREIIAMIKVVLADDEKKIIILLQKLIDWERLGYEIVGIANDGIRALELVKEKQPQILITDIRMPGCDGLELIQQIRRTQPKIHFVIISGYQQFEYAREALKYGVEDYLLKPLKKEELTRLLFKLREKLGEEASIEYRLNKVREKNQETLLSRLRGCVDRRQPFLSVYQVNEEFGFHFTEGCFFAAFVKPDISEAEKSKDGYWLMMQHALDILRREIPSVSLESAAAVFREGIGVIINCENYRAVEVKQCFMRIRKEIEKQRELFWDIRTTVCVGGRKTQMEALPESMWEALWLCKDRLCRNDFWRDAQEEQLSFQKDSQKKYSLDPTQKKALFQAAEYLNEEQTEKALEESCYTLLHDDALTGQMVEEWFEEALHTCVFGMRQSGTVEDIFFEKVQEKFWYCMDVMDVFRLLKKEILQEVRRLNEAKASQEARPIMEAKKYMQLHYQEALRLEDVSAVVGFNATYFSTFFKKETGMNFIDYLTELRIEKAKELLCQEEITINDAAETVGYQDLKHFSRLFKKKTGISPSDYRKMYR